MVFEGVAAGATTVEVIAGPSALLDFTENAFVNFIQCGADGKKTLNSEFDDGEVTITPVKIDGVAPPTERDADEMPWITTLTFNGGLPCAVETGSRVTLEPVLVRYRVNDMVLVRDISTDNGNTWETQPLISNVEDFQLAYAFDSDADGNAETGVDADDNPTGRIVWAVDSDGDGDLDTELPDKSMLQQIKYLSDLSQPDDLTGDPAFVRLVAVKMSIVVRSERQNPDRRFRDRYTRLTVQDHTPPSADPDGFRRRLMERDVVFRNLL
jgi:hypothetical protein